MTTSPTLDELLHKLDARFDHKNRVVFHPRKYQNRWSWGKEKWTYSRDLGVGALGVVWLEEEATTQQLRAVKRMTLLELTSRKIDFKRELQTLIALRSYESLFVQFFGWYHDENFVYFAMEYVAYGDLERYIQHSGTQARANAKEITRQLLEGLVVLHSRQICHRDLKPQNILIAALTPIHVKIADFGISKCTKGTRLDTQCGTSGYQAPELLGLLPRAIYRGAEYTDAVDMWALGCLLHQILTAEAPFLRKPCSREGGTLSDTDYTGLNTTDYPLLIDMNLFHEYCSGTAGLPTEKLRPHVTDSGLDFFKQLLIPDPRSRMSATEALNHKWMFKPSSTSSRKNVAEATQNQSKALEVKLSRETTERRFLEYGRSRRMAITPFLMRLPSLIENIPIALFTTAFRGYAQVFGIFSRPQHPIKISAYFPGRSLEWTVPQATAPGEHFNTIALSLERDIDINTEIFRDSDCQAKAHKTWSLLLMQSARLNLFTRDCDAEMAQASYHFYYDPIDWISLLSYLQTPTPSNRTYMHGTVAQLAENELQLNFIDENPTTVRIALTRDNFKLIERVLVSKIAASISHSISRTTPQKVERGRHPTIMICSFKGKAIGKAKASLWSQALVSLQVLVESLVHQSGEGPDVTIVQHGK